MKNILVTGGAGYIGSHTARLLAARGYNPVVFDDLSAGHRASVGALPFEQGAVQDGARLSSVLQQYRIEAVMHFAAFIDVNESVRAPGKYYQNNTEAVRSLLQTMAENNIPYLIFSSTAAIFGEPLQDKIDETHPQNPISPYGRSKMLAEKLLAEFDKTHGIKSTALRYFNASGADDSGEIGPSYQHETHLIPLILQTALGKRPALEIFGTDYPTPDGTCIRDYVHVNDLARAHVLALEKMERDNVSEQFNLGSGQGYSVAELIHETKKITARDFPVKHAPRRAGDPARLVADSSKAKRVLGWQPQYDLTRIIQTAWNWEQHRKY